MIRNDNNNKRSFMILLNSVGTALTRKLITHPINEDGTIDKNEGTAAHVYDLDNEWYCNLSIEDFRDFFVFIEETQDVNNVVYKDWKKSIWGLWEEANNCYLNLEAI
tara:strand:+ start:188 stop:508 length:321 start_codon:yes stop_codon:yes gene_type:complete